MLALVWSVLVLVAAVPAIALAQGVNGWVVSGGPEPYMRVPARNPLTREKVMLGRQLFFDPQLSADGAHSCASCHDPERAFTDGRAVAEGVSGRQGTRNTPSLVNRGWGSIHFWDGRAETLEEQALTPLQDPKEMNMRLDAVVSRLKSNPDYGARFKAVFHRDISSDDLASAIASYVRTIRSGNARFDRFVRDGAGYTDQELLGLNVFNGKGNCHVCHGGRNFTDEAFHNTGVAWLGGRLVDEGRFAITGKAYHHGAFKTPSLREVARTAPYMHDGSLKTLEEVVEFYDRGGHPNPYLDVNMIGPLHLTPEERQALVAFLKTLSGTIQDGM